MNPKVSVIMPVYNTEKYLKYSIESILNQTFKDFEFIIINDGSTDNSLQIIKEYAEKDYRIKILDQKNTGVIGALNNGLKQAKGEYFARMDADDISDIHRLEKQIHKLEDEKASMCGTWAHTIDENNKLQDKKFNYPPLKYQEIKKYLIKGNPFIHPTIILKKEIYTKEKDRFGNLYRKYKHIEDYELWTRIVPKYKSVNLEQYLIEYRVHSNQLTKKFNLNMKLKGIFIRILFLIRIFISFLKKILQY